jgi:hypothetical protein
MPEGGPISADLQEAVIADWQQQLENLVTPFRSQIAIHGAGGHTLFRNHS